MTNECGNNDIPFEFIQNIGTNAGLDFNIEDGRIESRLICHESEEEIVYVDSELGNMCLSLTTNTPSIMKEEILLPEEAISTLYFVKVSTKYGIITKKVLRTED